MEMYRGVISESVTPETAAEILAPPPPVWPEDAEVQGNQASDDDLPPPESIDKSVDAVYERYIQTKPQQAEPPNCRKHCSSRIDQITKLQLDLGFRGQHRQCSRPSGHLG